MTSPTLPLRVATLAGALCATLLAAGCAQEAGRNVIPADFGNATMNNHLVQTCRAGPNTSQAKYTSSVGGCPGRNLDGKYAQRTYEEYIGSAVPQPQFTLELNP